MLLTGFGVGRASSAFSDTGPDRLQIDVLEFRFQSPTSNALGRLTGRLELFLEITNVSSQALAVSESQWQLHYAERSASPRPRRTDRLFRTAKVLPPGESVAGWISFQVASGSPREVPLRLEWNPGARPVSVDLNAALRRLMNVRTERIGHQGCLARIRISRTIDLPALWVIDRELRNVSQAGVSRVVLSADRIDQKRLPTAVFQWLKQAGRRGAMLRQRVPRGFPPPVQFTEFHVSGFQYSGHHPGPLLHASETEAIAAAVRSLYEGLPVAEALRELSSDIPGIRRAALESCIDRLSDAELQDVLSRARQGTPADLKLTLDLLDRVSSPLGVSTLQETLLSWMHGTAGPRVLPDTVRTAARTLVRCIGPDTDAALRSVWAEAVRFPDLREAIVQEIMETQDLRWLAFVSEHATVQLERASASPRSSDAAAPADAGTGDNSTAGRTPAQPVPPDPVLVSPHLPRMLAFLHRHDGTFLESARKYLLRVTDPKAQDVLLGMVASSPELSDAHLAAACITRRLESGLLTSELIRTIQQSPDSRWTERLYDLQQSGQPQYRKMPVFAAVLRCATDEQLSVIIDSRSLPRRLRPQLLRRLIEWRHPRAVDVLAESLDGSPADVAAALRAVAGHLTPEILQLLLDRYHAACQAIAAADEPDVELVQRARQLLGQIGQVDHPEARRAINRSLISPVEDLRREARLRLQRDQRFSSVRRRRDEVWEKKRQGQYREALELANELVELDPLSADLRLVRASLLLRADDVASALEDIEQANRFSPGDVFTESTLALARVRSGNIHDGLELAEQTLRRVPPQVESYYRWTLYNTACVYGRAAEQKSMPDSDRAAFRQRGLELLTQSVDAGIDDFDHVTNDPDLIVFHDDPAWPDLLKRIERNAAGKAAADR